MGTLDEHLADLVGTCDLGVSPAVAFAGHDPVLPTRVRVGESAAIALGALASTLAEVCAIRTGGVARSTISVRAAAAAVMSLFHTTVNGAPLVPVATGASGTDMSHMNPTVDLYRTADGRWIHLHGAFPHLAERTLRVLECDARRAAIAAAVGARQAAELEDALAAAGTCGAIARSAGEWAEHRQGRLLGATPPVRIERLDDGASTAFGPSAGQPLDGVRVLDLSRVIAGPTVGKLLAAHGADVLRVNAPDLPDFETAVLDTGHGKWSAHADLRRAPDADRLRKLIGAAHVVIDAARAGALDRAGFGVDALREQRPGIVVVSLNCYGFDGPWAPRPGFDHLAQTVAGLSTPDGPDGRPVLVPAPACDSVAGYLAAAGAVAALVRRDRDGGSYHVTTSLTRAAMWIDSLGRTDHGSSTGYRVDDLLTTTTGPHGEVVHLRPPFALGGIPAGWRVPSARRGTHPLAWPTDPAAGPTAPPNSTTRS